MTDQNGNTCAWAPGGDGTCPDDSSSSGGGPVIHSYLSPHAVAEGDHVRVVMTGSQRGERPQLETTTLRPGEEALPVAPVLHGEAELEEAIVPELSAIGDRVLLSWETAERQQAALLGSDGALATSPVTVGNASGYTFVRRIGQRWLALQLPLAGGDLVGTWITPDGAIDGTVTIASEVESLADLANDPTGAAPLGAFAFFRQAGDVRELRVVRFDLEAARVDADSLLIARSEPDQVYLRGASIGTAADGSVLVLYARHDENFVHEVRAVTIARDGTMLERTTPLGTTPQLLARERSYFATSVVDDDTMTTATTQLLGLDGSALGPANVSMTTRYGWPKAVATTDGYALVNAESSVSVAFVASDASPQGTTVVASSYEVDSGGCHAGRAGSAAIALALLGVRRRRSAAKSQSASRVRKQIKNSV